MKRKLLICLIFTLILIPFLLCHVKADGELQDYVDNNSSDLDGSGNEGTMSNFTAEKYGPDSVNDTLTEALHSNAGEKTPDLAGTTGDWVNVDNVRDDNTGTYAYQDIPGNTAIGFAASLAAYQSTPTYVNTIRYYITRSSTYINEVRISIYNEQTSSYVTIYQGSGTWNAWTNLSLGQYYYTDEMYLLFNNSHASITYQARINELDFYNATHYGFDREIQWTNANYTRMYEELCLYAGTTGAENIPVYVRSGSSWVLLLSDLTANSWNNVSVSSYLTSATFTLRFGSGPYTGQDDTQDSWQIDAAVLHTWDVNQAPTAGEFQASTTVYANQYAFINHTIQDLDGNTTFANSTLTIVNGTSTFLWVSATNTFSESSDPSNYWTLDAANSLRIYMNATSFRLCFKLKGIWTFLEGAISVNVTVFDTDGTNGTATGTGLFSFEDDLIVQSAMADNYANPSGSISVNGLLYYYGTSTPPEDTSSITGYVALGATVKGFDSTVNSTGFITVTFNAEPSIGNSTYNVYAVTDEPTVQNGTVWNLVDRWIVNMTVANNRINVDTNASISVSANSLWDGAPFDGTFTLNYTTYSHSTPQSQGYTVASVSGGSRAPITSIQTNDEDYVSWDYVIANITVAVNSIDVNTNASIIVTGTYALDSTPFDGSFTLNYTTFNQSTPQRQGYTVTSVSGGSYGITVIGVNDEDYVIWNRALIESGGLTSAYLHVGSNITAYFVIKYEYEGTFITDGSVLMNGTAMTYNATSNQWECTFTEASLGSYGYLVNLISGNSYGITALNDLAGLQNCTFYANVNFRTVDTNGTIFSGATVYMSNGTSGIAEGGPGYSAGSLMVGITYYSIEATDGWANWTDITNGTLTVYATWKGLTVNATFSFNMTADTNKDIKCLCYPFTLSGTTYYAASNATITSCVFSNYMLTVQFSGGISSYILCVSGPKPTYLLNVTYDLVSHYTTFLELPHQGDKIISVNYQNWGGTYVQKTDKIITAVTVEGQKLTMTFTETVSEVGEVDVYCGTRGNPPETGGFTTSSYVNNIFIGYYVFNATEKTVYLQWSATGPGPIGPIQYPEYQNVYIEIFLSFPKIVQPGQKVKGTLNVTWSGVNTINLETLGCEAPFENWTIQTSNLPIILSLNATLTKGFVQIPVTLTIPASVATGTYNVPCATSFTAAPNLVRGFRSALTFQVAIPAAPVPTFIIFASLGSIALFILVTALFTTRRRKRPF